MTMGVNGLSFRACTFEMAVTTSIPELTLPNTGCLDAPGENQSRKSLFATFRKNCDPPEFGAPRICHAQRAGRLESFDTNSSMMLPPFLRVSSAPVARFTKVPSGGPPVPARGDAGSREWTAKPDS